MREREKRHRERHRMMHMHTLTKLAVVGTKARRILNTTFGEISI